jgi:hypothetical protein
MQTVGKLPRRKSAHSARVMDSDLVLAKVDLVLVKADLVLVRDWKPSA